ncbi:hypothetical protein ACWDUN_14220 [Mycobacterium sp. NPDC003323]
MSAEEGYGVIPATKGVGVLATAVVTTLGIALYGGAVENSEFRTPQATVELTPDQTPMTGADLPGDIAALRSEDAP